MIWYYAKGKPIEMVQVSGHGGGPLEMKAAIAKMSDAELKAELLDLAAGLG